MHGKTIYLDNAATSCPKPPSVVSRTQAALEELYGNPARSHHAPALKSAEAVYSVREAVSELIGLSDPCRVVFTASATAALNTVLFGQIREPCHVLISDLEHNSVLRPIEALARRIGITYTTFATQGNIESNIRAAIRHDTKYIVSTLASNVSGRIVPLEVLSRIRSQYRLCVIADASQLIGHIPIDLQKTPVDALCAPGHKALFGYMGCGFLALGSERDVSPLLFGGSGSQSRSLAMPQEYPEHLEAGTLPFYSILSMGYGIAHIREMGIAALGGKVESLTRSLSEDLSEMQEYRCLCEPRVGILSLSSLRHTADEICDYLNQNGIYTRCGLHCAPMAHRAYHTEQEGLVRLSLSSENTQEQMRCVRDALWQLAKK